MILFNPFRRSKSTNSPPTVQAGPKFTQGHRLTLNFIVELLETLRDRQHDYHIDGVLGLHIGHLADIYAHVVTHLKSTSDTPDSNKKLQSKKHHS